MQQKETQGDENGADSWSNNVEKSNMCSKTCVLHLSACACVMHFLVGKIGKSHLGRPNQLDDSKNTEGYSILGRCIPGRIKGQVKKNGYLSGWWLVSTHLKN